MKKLFIFLLFPSLLIATEIDPKLSTDSVIVFLSGAQITGHATVQLPKGSTEVLFSDLSPKIDPNSIQVSGLEEVVIASVNYSVNFIEKKEESEKIKNLQQQISTKSRALSVLQHKIKGLEEEKKLLATNNKINTGNQQASLSQLTAYANHYRSRIATIHTEIYDIQVEVKEIQQSLNNFRQEVNKLRSKNTEERGEIRLKLDAPASTSLKLEVSYNVTDAGWFPSYDIKSTDTESPLSFYYKANVYQETGSDWKDVAITLSTGDPTLNTEKPIVDPHYLNFVNPHIYRNQAKRKNKTTNYKYNPTISRISGTVIDDTGMPVPGVNVVVQGTSTGTQTDFDGNYNLKIQEGTQLVFSSIGFVTEEIPIYASRMNVSLIPDSSALDEVVVTGYTADADKSRSLAGRVSGVAIEEKEAAPPFTEKTENMTNIQFSIAKQYTVPSSSEMSMIEIDTFEIPASYEYYTAPLLSPNVFLTAKIKEWEEFDILPGEANIYFDGSFAGTTFLSPLQTEEELVISLGADSGIVVERNQVNDHKDKSFFGNTRIINRNYEISIRNTKTNSVEITILDRIPISQNKEIKVEEIEYGNAEYDSQKGIAKWNVSVAPNERLERKLSYEVRYPKEKHINLN